MVGLAESHCVKETALDAKKLGFEVHVIENLTEPVSEELGIAARRQMSEATSSSTDRSQSADINPTSKY